MRPRCAAGIRASSISSCTWSSRARSAVSPWTRRGSPRACGGEIDLGAGGWSAARYASARGGRLRAPRADDGRAPWRRPRAPHRASVFVRATQRSAADATCRVTPPEPIGRRVKVGRSFRAVVALSLLGSVGLALSPRGASGWQAAISIGAFPPHFTNTEGLGVAATAEGDVVVVGWYEFAVIKLAGKTGQEIWRYSLGPGYTAAVAVDAAGDVLAAGSTTLPVFRQFTVVKLSGETGAEVWRRDISGTDPVFSDGFGAGIASDAAGDVLASGYVNGDAIVVKLSGDAGTELWRYAGGGGTGLVYSTVKVDPHGDAIAAGAFGPAWTVVKLAGVSGAQVWRDDIPDLEYVAISLSGSGDVAAEGWTGSVFFLSGTDGSELWRRVGN